MVENNFFSNDLSSLKNILNNSNKRIFLVTGKKSFIDSGAQKKIKPYLKNKEVYRFSDFNVNPRIEDLKKGVQALFSFKADIVIGIGGGSVLDMAKLINIVHAQDKIPAKKIVLDNNLINKKGLKLIAIPTTAGTGSEVTQFAVIYLGDKKYSLDHELVLPDAYIIEPCFAYDLPPYIMACAAFDALSQATESYWSIKSNNESKQYAEQAIKIILKSLIPAVTKKDLHSIRLLFVAANLAGKAINITRTTAPHALSYPLTKFYDVPHGHAVALTLGKFFIINASANKNINDQRGKKYISNTMNELYSLFGCDNEFKCKDKWYKIMEEASLELDLKKLGVKNISDVKKIISNINLERLNNNPVVLNQEDLKNIFNINL